VPPTVPPTGEPSRVINSETSLAAVDIDNDGDIDVVMVSDVENNKVSWFENQNGEFEEHELENTAGFTPTSVCASNLVDATDDTDAYVELVVGTTTGLVWYSPDGFEDASNRFGSPQDATATSSSHVYAVACSGNIVVAATAENRVEVWLSDVDSSGLVLESKLTPDTTGTGTSSTLPGAVALEDINGDDEVDVVSAGDEDSEFSAVQLILGPLDQIAEVSSTSNEWVKVESECDSAVAVSYADMDGDADIDLVAAGQQCSGSDYIKWYQSEVDSSTNVPSFVGYTVQANPDGVQAVYAGDISADGFADVVWGDEHEIVGHVSYQDCDINPGNCLHTQRLFKWSNPGARMLTAHVFVAETDVIAATPAGVSRFMPQRGYGHDVPTLTCGESEMRPGQDIYWFKPEGDSAACESVAESLTELLVEFTEFPTHDEREVPGFPGYTFDLKCYGADDDMLYLGTPAAARVDSELQADTACTPTTTGRPRPKSR
jgi:hypothetical protein